MKDQDKTKKQIINELKGLRQRIAELEASENERRPSEEVLRESEERFKGVVDNIGIGVSLISPDMEILFLNRQLKQWFPHINVSEKPICYRSFNTPPRENICSYCPTYKTLQDGQVHESITETLVGGEIRNYRVISSPIKDKDGKIVAAIEMVEDVTERKEIERRLQESEEKYRKQFEEALDAIFIADAETGILIDCNRAASELVGREKSELVGKHQRTLHPQQETEREFSKTFKQHLEEKEGKILEAQVITKNGEIKDVAIKANLFEVKGKKLLQGIFRDITERKRVEEGLWENEKKYRRLVETLQEGIWVIDRDGNTTFVNSRMVEMLGYTVNEMQGKHLFLFMDKRCIEICKDYLERCKQGIKEQHEFEFVRKDGTHVYTLLETSSITNDAGNYAGAIAGVLDITDRKKVEVALRRREEELKKRIKEFEEFYDMAVGRELRMIKLKEEIESLKAELSKYKKDDSV